MDHISQRPLSQDEAPGGDDATEVHGLATARAGVAGDSDQESTSPPGWPAAPAPASEDVQEPGEQSGGAVMLGGRYLLEERIAAGGMAAVWRAHDEVLARTVAVKILHGHLAADAAFRERFRREAVSAAKLTHPAVVGVYDTGTDGDSVYLVMEFVDGVTLKDVIAESGTLSVGETATIGEKVARGLAYAHGRGLVHRDVKPANILIGHDGSVKVADFGIAQAEEAGEDLTKTGMMLGTAAYVAPEQITAQVVDGRADQYALGCVLYEALVGQQPFKGDNAVATAAQRLDRAPLPVRQVRADVPRGLSAVLDRALAKDPEDRFPTSAALADALAPYADADADHTAALVAPVTAAHVDGGSAATADDTTPADPSFLRSEGRWLAPVLALLVLAGVLVAVGLASGVLEGGDRMPFTFARGSDQPTAPPTSAPAETTTLRPGAIDDFDPPPGDGRENPDDVGAVIDGDPGTAWTTEGYDSPALGNLKPGVGFTIDLETPAELQRVTLTTTTPGISYEVHVPAGPDATPAGGGGPEGWRRAAALEHAPATATAELGGVPGDRVLVWITGDLQPDGRRFRAGFSDVVIEGAARPQR